MLIVGDGLDDSTFTTFTASATTKLDPTPVRDTITYPAPLNEYVPPSCTHDDPFTCWFTVTAVLDAPLKIVTGTALYLFDAAKYHMYTVYRPDSTGR